MSVHDEVRFEESGVMSAPTRIVNVTKVVVWSRVRNSLRIQLTSIAPSWLRW